MTTSSPAAVAFLVREECPGGVPPMHPYWPGDMRSGVTIGVGYDLGQRRAADLARDWGAYLMPDVLSALEATCGYRGTGAGHLIREHGLAALVIPVEVSRTVFAADTLPDYEQQLREAMPGADALPPDAFGALTSLVYNRGPGMEGDRRIEMRAIRSAVAAFAATELPSAQAAALRAVADQLRDMAERLWPSPAGTAGWPKILHDRRYGEAALVEGAAVTLEAATP